MGEVLKHAPSDYIFEIDGLHTGKDEVSRWRLSSKLVAVHAGQVLLGHLSGREHNQAWTLPGGGVNAQSNGNPEPILEAMLREMCEEGYVFNEGKGDLVAVTNKPIVIGRERPGVDSRGRKLDGVLKLCSFVELSDPDVITHSLSGEIDQAGYFALDQLPPMIHKDEAMIVDVLTQGIANWAGAHGTMAIRHGEDVMYSQLPNLYANAAA